MQMPLFPTWTDIVVRLLLTMIAGALMGFNRGAKGHAAGLRTTILVALAASIAMIQANILLPLDGKQSSSFAVMDLMRLPLGILTGVRIPWRRRHSEERRLDHGTDDCSYLMDRDRHRTLFRRRAAWTWRDFNSGRADHALGNGMDRRPHPTRPQRGPCCRTPPGSPTPGLDELLRPRGYRVRLRQQNRSLSLRNEEEIETRFDLTWKQTQNASTSLDFLAVVENICRVKSFELVAGGEH